MIEVYNAITNIANDIEKNVFVNYDNFVKEGKSAGDIHNDIYAYCSRSIEKEFEYLKSVKGVVGKDKKQLSR